MTGWHLAHLFILAAWAGLVLGELVIEAVSAGDHELRRAAARFHRAIDLYIEIPLLTGVVVTGVVLMGRANLDASLWIKIACGLGAVGINIACAVAVLLRARAADAGADEPVLAGWTRWVWRSGAVGVPLGLAALVMGGTRVGWW